jgi:thiosulfate/3-mercaptopyruvate sulfurtransferase
MTISPIISFIDAEKKLNDQQYRFMDCRFSLQNVLWGWNSYQQDHIPGALYADLNLHLSSPVSPGTGRHPLPDENIFVEFLCSNGIEPEITVIAYDDAFGSLGAARLFWLLHVYGHFNVQVLDGSYSTWKCDGFPSSYLVPTIARTRFSGQKNLEMIVNAEEVELAITNPELLLIDARSNDRFNGQNEVIDPIAGRIPGAVNRPVSENINFHSKFKTSNELNEEFTHLMGHREPENIILYCGSGVTACHNYLAMEIAGLHGAKIYAGSWSEWITNPDHKIAIGA